MCGRDVNETLVTESERQYPSVGDGDEDAAVRQQMTFGSGRPVHLQAGVKKSESGVVCCEGQLSKCRAEDLVDRESDSTWKV